MRCLIFRRITSNGKDVSDYTGLDSLGFANCISKAVGLQHDDLSRRWVCMPEEDPALVGLPNADDRP